MCRLHLDLCPARKLPWSLASSDDIPNALAQLKQGGKPNDTVSGKVWELMQLGVYDAQCEAGIKLLREAPWGAAAVEEGHASTTMMLRKHTYDDYTLRTRAALAQARPLFSGCRLVKKVSKAQGRMSRLRRKQPSRMRGGGHMLIGDMLRLVAKKRAQGVYTDRHIGKKVVKFANKSWQALGSRTRELYDAEAVEVAAKKQLQLHGALKEAATEVQRLATELAATRQSAPLRMSNCAFSQDELARFEETWASMGRAAASVAEFEQTQQISAGEPPDLVKSELEKHTPPVASASSPVRFWWTSLLCVHRDHFQHVVFRWEWQGSVRLAMFAFAMQRPHIVGFLEFSLVQSSGASASSSSSTSSASDLAKGKNILHASLGRWLFSDEGFVHPEAEVSVLPGLIPVGGPIFASDGDWRPLRSHLKSLPPVAERDGQVQGAGRGGLEPNICWC